MRALLLLLLFGCNKQTEPAVPFARLESKEDFTDFQRLGPAVLAGRSFSIDSDWSGECTQWQLEHAPINRDGRQTCDYKKYELSASCEPACSVRIDGHRAWILPSAFGLHRVTATLRGPTVASFDFGTTVVTARAIVISGCVIAQKREDVYAMPTGTVCRLGAHSGVSFAVIASNMPIKPGLERFYKEAQAMRAALGDYPSYKALAAYQEPIVAKFGVDVTIGGKQVRWISSQDLGPPGMYPVTIEYKDIRAEVTLEVLPPDLSP